MAYSFYIFSDFVFSKKLALIMIKNYLAKAGNIYYTFLTPGINSWYKELKGMIQMSKRIPKLQRQEKLQEILSENPFITDDDLAQEFGCSVQTIRLDRLELGIPELRERVKKVAQINHAKVRSIADKEIIGELIELELGKKAVSVLQITSEMVADKPRFVGVTIFFRKLIC